MAVRSTVTQGVELEAAELGVLASCLEIVEVDTEDNTILVKGAVPGPNGGYVVVRRAKR